jgi:hypothetical protein
MQDEITELPNKWYVKATKDNELVLRDWRGGDHTGWKDNLVMLSDKCWGDLKYYKDYTEITFEQFKKWVLKEEDLIEKAKKKYPVGTKFCPAHIDNKTNSFCIITDDTVFKQLRDTVIATVNDRDWIHCSNKKYGNTNYDRIVYYKNKWAEIIEPEIDSWCVKVNDDNVKIVKEYFTNYPNNAFQNGSVYGIDKTKIQNYLQKSESGNYISLFDRLITTEEFYEKIGYVPEKKYDHEVVHCTTQEEWDFVYKAIKSTQNNWFEDKNYGNSKSFCINIKIPNYSQSLEFYQKLNSKIYSFQEWCDKFGHKPDFNKSIEKWSVGSYVVFLVDYGRHPKGSFSKITRNEDKCVVVELVFEDKKQGCRLYKNTECEWFPTLKEAEEFAKSLVKPTEQFTKPLTPEECYPNVNVGDVVSWDCSAGEYEVWKVKDGRFWIIYEGEKNDYQNYSLDVKGLKVVKKSNECYDGNKVNTYFRHEPIYIDCKPWTWEIDLFKTHQLTNKKGKKFSPIKAELINVKKLKIKK